MNPISIRYGETVTLSLDTGDLNVVSADIYVGKPGEIYVLRGTTTVTDGVGVFVLSQEDTSIPLGVYYYQINTTDVDGNVEKYPSPSKDCDYCEDEDFPQFIVGEALDEMEIS